MRRILFTGNQGKAMEFEFDEAKVTLGSYGYEVRIPIPERLIPIFTEGQGKRRVCEIRRYRKKRSLDANSYCWVICDKIAERLNATKEEVYRKAVSEVGVFFPLRLENEALDEFIKAWDSNGIGWFSRIEHQSGKYAFVHAYAGSSTYSTVEMSRLIDWIVSEAKELNIETATPDDVARMMALWERNQGDDGA
jgi:hypothetical protein